MGVVGVVVMDGVDDVAEWKKTKRDPLATEQAWNNWKLVWLPFRLLLYFNSSCYRGLSSIFR